MPLWVPAFELDWPLLSKSKPCQQKLETHVKTTCRAWWCISAQVTFSLRSPLPDENRELCEECVCNEQLQNTKTACWVITHFFAGICFLLLSPDTHTVLYEWLFERHLLTYFSFLSLVLGDKIQPKAELCHSPIFSDVVFWRITHSKQKTRGWLAS